MKQAHIFVSGFVQGVGYRAFVKKQAKKLGLTGWVQNLPDGRVEAILQGTKDNIEKLIEICKKGPYFSEVKEIVVEWDPSASSRQGKQEKFDSFEIRK